MKSAISIKNLQKSFGVNVIFKDFTVKFEKEKITAIFGPNGSGKSTLLNILAGVISADGGKIQMNNLESFKFSYIFQNYRESLLPWLTNLQNLAFPLELQKMSRVEIERRLRELKKLFEFNINWEGYPYQLSGGQQQILAFMRALITRPIVLFIDEPFSALDYENNLRLREHLQKYYLKYRPTILLITHNIEEAVHLAGRIMVLSKRPTQILREIDNSLLYPRTVKTLESGKFHKIKDTTLEVFRNSVKL